MIGPPPGVGNQGFIRRRRRPFHWQTPACIRTLFGRRRPYSIECIWPGFRPYCVYLL